MEFNSFEEISTKYPIDGKSNMVYVAGKSYTTVYNDEYDLECARKQWPYGYKDGFYYKFWRVLESSWYTHYIFDGQKWYLGIENFDGVQRVYGEYNYGIVSNKYGTHASFRTHEEAEEYCKTKASITTF